jgi:hypothetical protein
MAVPWLPFVLVAAQAATVEPIALFEPHLNSGSSSRSRIQRRAARRQPSTTTPS